MSSANENLQRVNRIFQEALDDDSIVVTEATCAEDLEDWDSLMHITLITAVEKEFGFKFTLNEIGSMQNVGEMMQIIAARATK